MDGQRGGDPRTPPLSLAIPGTQGLAAGKGDKGNSVIVNVESQMLSYSSLTYESMYLLCWESKPGPWVLGKHSPGELEPSAFVCFFQGASLAQSK